MTVFLLAASVTGVVLALLWWRARDLPPPVLTLGAIAGGLILLALPVPWLMIRVTTTFKQIAATGTSSLPVVSEVILDVDRTLLWGSIGIALVVGVALGRQVLVGRDGPRSISDLPAESETPPPLTWRERTLAWTLIAIVPTVAAVTVASSVPPLVAGPGLDLILGTGMPSSDGTRGLSQTIAFRLIAGVITGGFAVIVVAFAVMASIAVAGAAASAQRLQRFVTIAAGIVVLSAAGNAIRLVDEIGWIRARVKLATEAEARRRADSGALAGSVSTSVADAVPVDPAKTPPAADIERNAPGLTLDSLRRDGVYIADEKLGDNFHYWKFNADGTCSPGAAPSAAEVFVPPPPPAGMRWTCAVVDRRLVFTFVSANVTETTRGAIVTRDHIRLEGADFRFIPLPRRR